MSTNELIDQLIEDTNTLIKQVTSEILPLSEEAITYKPSGDKWSILECIAHINIANKHYHDQIELKLQNHKTTPKEHYTGGALGNYFTKMMKPKQDLSIPGKMKTIGKFKPVMSTKESNHSEVLDAFLKDQHRLLGLLETARSCNLAKIKIKSALGGWLMFKLGDAFRFMLAHTQRHVLQAMNALKAYQSEVKAK